MPRTKQTKRKKKNKVQITGNNASNAKKQVQMKAEKFVELQKKKQSIRNNSGKAENSLLVTTGPWKANLMKAALSVIKELKKKHAAPDVSVRWANVSFASQKLMKIVHRQANDNQLQVFDEKEENVYPFSWLGLDQFSETTQKEVAATGLQFGNNFRGLFSWLTEIGVMKNTVFGLELMVFDDKEITKRMEMARIVRKGKEWEMNDAPFIGKKLVHLLRGIVKKEIKEFPEGKPVFILQQLLHEKLLKSAPAQSETSSGRLRKTSSFPKMGKLLVILEHLENEGLIRVFVEDTDLLLLDGEDEEERRGIWDSPFKVLKFGPTEATVDQDIEDRSSLKQQETKQETQHAQESKKQEVKAQDVAQLAKQANVKLEATESAADKLGSQGKGKLKKKIKGKKKEKGNLSKMSSQLQSFLE